MRLRNVLCLCALVVLCGTLTVVLAQDPQRTAGENFPVSAGSKINFAAGSVASNAPLMGPSGLFNGIWAGNTRLDEQALGTCQRMIQTGIGDLGERCVHVTWAVLKTNDLLDLNAQVNYNCFDWSTQSWTLSSDDHGGITINPVGERAGYSCVDVSSDGNAKVPLHSTPGGWADATLVTRFLIPGFGVFLRDFLSNPPDAEVIRPRGAISRDFIAGDIYHVVSSDCDPEVENSIGDIAYWRYVKDDGHWDGPVIMDSSMTVSYLILAEDMSDRVILAFAKSRDYGPGRSMYDNDLVYYESTVAGEDWITYGGSPMPWEAGGGWNVTDYVDEDEHRAYIDLAGGFTSDGRLHLVYTTRYSYDDLNRLCKLLHWDEGTPGSNGNAQVSPGPGNGFNPTLFHTVANAMWINDGAPGEWNLNIAKMSLAIGDGSTMCVFPNLDYLYLTYTQFGSDDPLDQQDASASGMQNGNIWMSISRDYGQYWSPQQCITTTDQTVGGPPTRSPGCDGSADNECLSEHWSSCAETVNDTLHVFYIGDLDAGSIARGEGSWSLNDVMYLPIPGGYEGDLCPVVAPVLDAWMSNPDGGMDCYIPSDGSFDYEELTVENSGNADLIYSVDIYYPGTGGWLYLDGASSIPTTALPPGGGKNTYEVLMDGTGLAIGMYEATIQISHNDPAKGDPYEIPIKFFYNAGMKVNQVDYVFPNATQLNSNVASIEVDVNEFLSHYGMDHAYLNGYTDYGWVIQNIRIDDDMADFIKTYFGIDIPPGTDLDELPIHIQITLYPLTAVDPWPEIMFPVSAVGFNAEGANLDGERNTVVPGPPVPVAFDPAGETFETVMKNQAKENVQAASQQCVPASVANSLQFLENRYGINVPHENDPGVGGDNTLVGQLDEHMDRKKCTPLIWVGPGDGDSACSCTEEPPTRTDGCGVSFENMINGKFEYLKANGLEDALVHKHQVDDYVVNNGWLPEGDFYDDDSTMVSENETGDDGKVTWEWIHNEIRNGEDVELIYGYYDNGNRVGGHAVRVFGAGKSNGKPWLMVKHDALQTDQNDPDDEKGCQEWFVWIEDSDNDGRLNFGSDDTEIDFALSESPAEHEPILDLSQKDFLLNGMPYINTDWGSADLTFVGNADIMYFNLSINGSWQVQNVGVLSVEGEGVPQTMTYEFDLGVPWGTEVTSVEYGFSLTETTLEAAPPTIGTAVVFDRSVIFNPGIKYINPVPPLGAYPLVGGPVADPVKHAHANFPNQECGLNECVPAAVSNSLKFLNDRHEMGLDDNDLDIEDMKTATNWAEDGCWIDHDDDRPDGQRNAWWEDKAQYMEDNEIPVTTRKITDLSELAAEIDAGQDVELVGSWHCAAVVGIKDLGGGRYEIDIVHDTKQGEKGGTVTETIEYDPATKMFGGSPGFFSESRFEYAIVECPGGTCDCGNWGDVNGDGNINPVDVVFMVNFVYLGNDMRVQPPNCPYEAGDANCDTNINPVDVVFYVNFVYLGNNMFCPDPCP